jgi:prevent-host-death family protein
MGYVNIHEAKTRLSQLIEAVESGAEGEIIIARNGKPAARLVPLAPAAKQPRVLGRAKGKIAFDYEAFKALDAEVLEMFEQEAERKTRFFGV